MSTVEQPLGRLRREQRVQSAVHSSMLAGLTLTDDTYADAQKYVENSISLSEIVARVRATYEIQDRSPRGSGPKFNAEHATSHPMSRGLPPEAEADLVFARMLQLPIVGIAATADLEEICRIHRHLYQDLLHEAGALRTTDEPDARDPSRAFLPAILIEEATAFAVAELREDDLLRGMEMEALVARLARHYESFRYIRPFLHGNGQTQRAFWSRLTSDAGWHLAWEEVERTELDDADRAASNDGDFVPLHRILKSVIQPHRAMGAHVYAATPNQHKVPPSSSMRSPAQRAEARHRRR